LIALSNGQNGPKNSGASMRKFASVAAKTLRDLRRKAGLSVAEVAAAMGTTEDALAGIEGGEWIGKVELDLLYRYADAVGAQLRFVVQPLESGN
jgi:transcriptional regulator with XRE-family HTH domain